MPDTFIIIFFVVVFAAALTYIIPVVIALGYDSITGIFITYVATQVGFATGPVNPFSAMLAQGIAGVPLLSGFRCYT